MAFLGNPVGATVQVVAVVVVVVNGCVGRAARLWGATLQEGTRAPGAPPLAPPSTSAALSCSLHSSREADPERDLFKRDGVGHSES